MDASIVKVAGMEESRSWMLLGTRSGSDGGISIMDASS